MAFTQQPAPHTGGGQQRSLQLLSVADGTFKPLQPRGTAPQYSPDRKMFVYTSTAQPASGGAPSGSGVNDIFLGAPGSQPRNLTLEIDRNMVRALTRPAELYYKASIAAPVQRLSDLNKDIASLQLGKTESVEWQNDKFTENGIGRYPIWKVAVAGAAVTDQLDQYNLGDGNGGRGNASPWVDSKAMERMREQSPITYAKNIKTPTLIMSDTGDYRVPITQSFKLYHALVDNGVVTKFIVYPVAGHSPGDPVRQRDVQRRWIGWLGQYLGGRPGTQ